MTSKITYQYGWSSTRNSNNWNLILALLVSNYSQLWKKTLKVRRFTVYTVTPLMWNHCPGQFSSSGTTCKHLQLSKIFKNSFVSLNLQSFAASLWLIIFFPIKLYECFETFIVLYFSGNFNLPYSTRPDWISDFVSVPAGVWQFGFFLNSYKQCLCWTFLKFLSSL